MDYTVQTLVVLSLVSLAVGVSHGKAATVPNWIVLSGDWTMQSSAVARADGSRLSQPGTSNQGWHSVTVPTTVLNALAKAGVYPDMRIGLDAYHIPDSSDEFNAKHDLAKFSHFPAVSIRHH